VDNYVGMCIKDMYDKTEMAKSKHILIGQLGENIAVGYLKNRGYSILERNYRKKGGEIDVIMEKGGVLHFIEVKSAEYVHHVLKDGEDSYRPEDHVHAQKKKRFARVVQMYLLEYNIPDDKEWTIDVVVVHINVETKHARVSIIEDVLLD